MAGIVERGHGTAQQVHRPGHLVVVTRQCLVRRHRRLLQALHVLQTRALRQQLGFLVLAQARGVDLGYLVVQPVL